MPPFPANTMFKARSAPPWAGLLGFFYERIGLPFPRLRRLKGDEMPEPYKRLLVHSRDMTPTLEGFFGDSLALSVLSRESDNDVYLREVTLDLQHGRPVEYGAIRIFLNRFPSTARERILSEQYPLGKILELEAIPHIGWPQAFFRVEADAHMRNVLRLDNTPPLFGRRNVLLDGSRHFLAEVVEILAPVQGEGVSAPL